MRAIKARQKGVKPEDAKQYNDWLRREHHVDITKRTCNHYQAVARQVKSAFEESALWTELNRQLAEFNRQFFLSTKQDLWVRPTPPQLDMKPFDSFLLKTYRKNVVNNNNWPDPPDGGWLLPPDWFSRVNDIVRTCFAVKFLDGVNFFEDKLGNLCAANQCEFRADYEAKEEGYYALHIYTKIRCEVPNEDLDTEDRDFAIEIQITTQLQEVIRGLLHKFYESRRKDLGASKAWQWDYKSDEFAANYLGHILHYVEGMIMEVRDKESGDQQS
jgi:hypothetical protein